jgi:hypothetical protein
MKQSIYQEAGYDDRKHYLACLSDEYNVSRDVVFMLASVLGSNEDFDGLVNSLEDMGFAL